MRPGIESSEAVSSLQALGAAPRERHVRTRGIALAGKHREKFFVSDGFDSERPAAHLRKRIGGATVSGRMSLLLHIERCDFLPANGGYEGARPWTRQKRPSTRTSS